MKRPSCRAEGFYAPDRRRGNCSLNKHRREFVLCVLCSLKIKPRFKAFEVLNISFRITFPEAVSSQSEALRVSLRLNNQLIPCSQTPDCATSPTITHIHSSPYCDGIRVPRFPLTLECSRVFVRGVCISCSDKSRPFQ